MVATKGAVSYESAMTMPTMRRKALLSAINYVHEIADRYAKEHPNEVDT